MLRRQREGSVICTSCGVLVGVNDDRCYNCGRRNPGLWGFAPAFRALGQDLGFVPFVLGTCVIVYGLTLVASGGRMGGMLAPAPEALVQFGASGVLPVFGLGRWWTVLSATWLHGNVLHIFMNMMALRQLATGVTDLLGPGRMVIVYTVGGVAGFTASSLAGLFLPPLPFIGAGAYTVGASASIAGLMGAILAYGHRSGSQLIRSYAQYYIVMLLVMGFIIPRVDNWAHAGGFGGGYLAAKLLDPLKPERIDHLVIAVICLALSIGSVVWSFVSFWMLLQQAG